MDIILDLLDGRLLAAKLARPFRPADGEMDVLVKGFDGIQKFLFPEICCMSMPYDPKEMFIASDNLLQEEVITLIK